MLPLEIAPMVKIIVIAYKLKHKLHVLNRDP